MMRNSISGSKPRSATRNVRDAGRSAFGHRHQLGKGLRLTDGYVG